MTYVDAVPVPWLSARQNGILLDYLPVSINGEAFFAGLQYDSAEETTRLLAGFLGSLQCFLNGMTVDVVMHAKIEGAMAKAVHILNSKQSRKPSLESLRLFHGMRQRTEPPPIGLNRKHSVRFPELPGSHAILDFIEFLLHFN